MKIIWAIFKVILLALIAMAAISVGRTSFESSAMALLVIILCYQVVSSRVSSYRHSLQAKLVADKFYYLSVIMGNEKAIDEYGDGKTQVDREIPKQDIPNLIVIVGSSIVGAISVLFIIAGSLNA